MCNAWNHPAGCRCGFGGEGHLGRGGDWGRGDPGGPLVSFPYHTSMRELARELGHSLVFPVTCRHCQQPIFLFTSHDGGFAIFDRLGSPWPKHVCSGISPATREYYSLNVLYSQRHRLPVPEQTAERVAEDGQEITGTVVTVDAGRAEIYDGQHRYWVVPSLPVRLGQIVRGTTRHRDGKVLLDIEAECLPTRTEILASEKAADVVKPQKFDAAKHNETMTFLGTAFRMKVKIVWVVMSDSGERVATFEYARQAEADALAAKLTQDRRVTYYVQKVKELMR